MIAAAKVMTSANPAPAARKPRRNRKARDAETVSIKLNGVLRHGAPPLAPPVASTVEDVFARCIELRRTIAAIIAKAETKAAAFRDELNAHEAALRARCLAESQSLVSSYGRVSYVRAGETVTVDHHGLRGYAVAHPEVMQFVTIKTRDASTRLTYEKALET